jgi:site-specific recombinase XerD
VAARINQQRGRRSPQTPRQTVVPHDAPPPKGGHLLCYCIEEYPLDHRSQNPGSKTLEWHQLSLSKLARFLVRQGIAIVEEIERVHLLSWLSELCMRTGAHGKRLAARSVNSYARSVRAFCNWLEARGYVSRSPAADVRMSKVGKPLIRIIEEAELKHLLKTCASLDESGPQADCHAARNRAILWLLYDTGIRLAELCGLRLVDLDRKKGMTLAHGKGSKEERRIALGRKALQALLLYVDHYRPTADQLVEMGNPPENSMLPHHRLCRRAHHSSLTGPLGHVPGPQAYGPAVYCLHRWLPLRQGPASASRVCLSGVDKRVLSS